MKKQYTNKLTIALAALLAAGTAGCAGNIPSANNPKTGMYMGSIPTKTGQIGVYADDFGLKFKYDPKENYSK